jgi:hypothetical protein
VCVCVPPPPAHCGISIRHMFVIEETSSMYVELKTTAFYSHVEAFEWIPPHMNTIKKTSDIYYKRDDFSFTIIICSNIPLSTAYGVYISQLIPYARACSTYDQFFSRSKLLTDKLMLQRFLQSRLMSAFRKFYGRYNDLIYNYKLSLSHMLSDIFHTNS